MCKLSRKFTSALLTLALLASVLPIGAVPAQAADTAGAFEVTGGNSGTDYSYSDGVLTINSDTALTISNTNPKTVTNDRIVIGNNVNASLTFNGVNISAPTDQSAIYVPSGSSLKITLADDSTNSTIGGNGSTGSAAPAIRLPDGATLTIEGTGTLNVTGGSSTGNPGGTGIGGYLYYAGPSPTAESCGTVIILSGTVTVTGGSYSAGIGGATNHAGTGGNGGTVVILSSSVTVTGGSSAVAIGGGNSSGSSRGNGGQGIKPTGDGTYTVYGNLTLPCDITIPQDVTVVIPEDASLIVPEGTKLTNNGTIVKNGGTFTNNGTLDGNPLGYSSTVAVSVSGDGVTGSSGQYTAAYGTTATLAATVTATGNNDQSASDGTVTFYQGTVDEGKKLNETPVNVSNSTATTTVSLSGENWTPNADNAYTITAVYTPGESNQLQPENGTGSLTVQPKTLIASLGGTLVKTYDGNTDAPEGIKIELEGVVSGENVSASSESISYDDGNVGTGKTITASDVELSGEDARNYTLGSKTTITTDAGVITAAEMTGSVTISGNPTVGKTLTANYSGTPSTGISYQWYRGDTPITDATGTSYTLTAADAGKSLSVRVTASGNYSGSVESESVTVQKTEQSAPETGAGYKIDYAAETISAENGYELAATKDANVGSAALTVTPGTDVYIRLAETATAYASDWTLVDVPARPAAPANVSGGTEQISGVDSSMEYRAVGSTSWTRCTGTNISNLSDGDYEVRIAATDSAFGSEAVQVHVSPYTGRFSYEISTSVGDNGTISVDRYATEGERVTITVSPDDAYKLDDLSVTAHGKDVELTDNGDGTYTFTMPSGDVKISATFAEDPDWTEPEEPATDVSEIFIDVAPNAWYKDAVQYAYDNGLMTGTSDTEFAPEATTTRAMIVSILARLENVTSAEAAGFADVSADDWYATAVNWAASAGVVSGTGDGNFSPNAAITREQLAAMLMNYSAWKGEDVSARADLSAYSDQPSTWAEETMSWAVAEGVINGVTADQLQPQASATRAQVAAILQRFLCK